MDADSPPTSTKPVPRIDDLPDLATVPEVAEVFRVSRQAVYAAVKRGKLPHLKLGNKILIPKHLLREFIDAQAGQR
jgi:excisionase family DNA binding protein